MVTYLVTYRNVTRAKRWYYDMCMYLPIMGLLNVALIIIIMVQATVTYYNYIEDTKGDTVILLNE